MPYVTSIERLGRVEGILQTRRKRVMEVLGIRFKWVPIALVEAIHQIEDLELLTTLLKRAVEIIVLAEFQEFLAPFYA